MKIFLRGNHSRLHAGASAVWRRMNQLVEEKVGAQLVSSMDECDCVIVNGEGSMHDNGCSSLAKLKFGKKAKDSGKKAYLINSVWQNMGECSCCGWGKKHDDYLKEFDLVCVRDLISLNEIKHIRPDAMIYTDLSYDVPVDLPLQRGSKKAVGSFFHHPGFKFPKNEYTKIIIKRFPTWEQYLNALSVSNFFVSGKHHEFFAACKLRIPFVAYRGNTDKVLGVIKRAEANIPVASTPEELKFNINNPPDIGEYNKLFDFLDKQKPFKLEDLGL